MAAPGRRAAPEPGSGEGEKGLDTCYRISAGDGDRAYNYALVNTSLAASSTPDDHVRACMKAFSARGSNPATSLSSRPEAPQGKVMYGMPAAYMRDTASAPARRGASRRAKMQMVPASGCLPGEAVVLSAGTGLIGTPKANDKGIEIKCLLNPRLRIGGRVRLDNVGGAGAEGRPRRPLPHPFDNLLRRHAGCGLVRHPVVRRH